MQLIIIVVVCIIELCAGAGAPAYFAGAEVGKLRQKLRQTKL
jgi:hypothetical protein